MRIEDLRLNVRPRSAWESVELGFHLARVFQGPVLRVWFAFTLPLAVLLLAAFWRHPGWALFLLWWFKPLLERFPIFVLSRAVFGEVPTVRQTLRQLPALLRSGVLGDLTLRRLDLGRTLRAPVLMLEGLKGSARARRWRALKAQGLGTAWATGALLLLGEIALLTAFRYLVMLFLPQGIYVDAIQHLFDDLGTHGWLRAFFVADYAILCLLTPRFSAAGFALYLNRRTHLEAWDLELAFRRMARRLAGGAVLLLLLGLGSRNVAAQAPSATPAQASPVDGHFRGLRSPSRARETAEEVLRGPEFSQTEKRKVWVRKRKPNASARQRRDDNSFEKFMEALALHLAPVLKYGLLAVLALALGWLLWHFRDHLHWGRSSRPAARHPQVIMGLDIRPEALPRQLPQRAWELWRQGARREAMGLLYRGALAALVHQHHGELTPGATEGDCLRLARRLLESPASAYFGELTLAWQRTAWAHLPPEDARAEALCRNWSRHFRSPGEASR